MERREGEDWTSELDGGGVTAANRRIQEILRLDFDAFTRAVVLPQGEFQRFLSGDPAQRRKILVELLGLSSYEQMGAIARAKAESLKQAIETVQSVLEQQYVGVDESALEALEASKTDAEQWATQIGQELKKAEALESQRTEASAAIEELEDISDRVKRSADELLALEVAVDSATKQKSKLSQEAERARSTLGELEAGLSDARARLAELTQAHGDLTAITRAEGALENLLESQSQHMQHESELESAEAMLTGAVEEERRRADALQAAQQAVSQAEATTATARTEAERAKEREEDLKRRAAAAQLAETQRSRRPQRCRPPPTRSTGQRRGSRAPAANARRPNRRGSRRRRPAMSPLCWPT